SSRALDELLHTPICGRGISKKNVYKRSGVAMCGILGAVWKAEIASSEGAFSACLGSLKHRGPDDRGQWFHRTPVGTVALGHTRLSIIDLSEGGHQPMH